MKNYTAKNIRNIAVVGHGGTGKTSLAEAMLFNTGAINRLGRVEDGTTTADYHPEEVKRGITVHTSAVPCEYEGTKLNILDTPGYSDFIGEVKGALRVAEGALFVVCGVSGVEVQTEAVWELAGGAARAVFINKLDRENANFDRAIEQLREKFGTTFVPFAIPIGVAENFRGVVDILCEKAYLYDGKEEKLGSIPEELSDQVRKYRDKLIEAAAEADDEYLMKYLDGLELTAEEISSGLVKGFKEAKFVPVLCGTATKNCGVKALMDFLASYFPAPQAEDGPLAALVFKTLADPYVGRMNYVSVFSGTLKSDSTVYNSNKEKSERVGQIFFVRGKTQQPTENVPAGDIAALVKLAETTTGDTLCEKDKPVTLEGIHFPEPTLSIAVEPKTQGDEDKLATALARLVEEEPTIRVTKNIETKQTIITGMGETQLEMIIERFKRKFGVDVVQKPLRIPYRETIRAEVKVEGKYKKQTGGRGQYGHVWLRIAPLPDEEFKFDEEIFGGAVPSQYFPAVEKGVREALNEGVLAGYPVTNVAVTLYDGSYHPVDSSEMAFKIAASMAFKKGAQQAKPVLLEPIMEVEVLVPENFMGDVIGDLNTKRGRILGMEPTGKQSRIRALVPFAEMARYAIDLKSITQGRGSFKMQFSSYEEVPGRIAEEIIKKAQEEKAEK
ncbi:MAG: elongation factor G [Firmicutes bacterium]|nr:elongation factor G [Bacillota bacterium]